jgi:hypothetical protein
MSNSSQRTARTPVRMGGVKFTRRSADCTCTSLVAERTLGNQFRQ